MPMPGTYLLVYALVMRGAGKSGENTRKAKLYVSLKFGTITQQ